MIKTLFPELYFIQKLPNHEEVKKTFMSSIDGLRFPPNDLWQSKVNTTFKQQIEQRYASAAGFNTIINEPYRHNTIDNSKLPWSVYMKNLNELIKNFLNELNVQVDYKVDIIENWLNQYVQGMYQELHTHVAGPKYGTTFGINYFLKYDPNKDCKFFFYNAKHAIQETTGMTEMFENSPWRVDETFFPDVKEGDVIIFPSYLMHGVSLQENVGERITLTTNIRVERADG